MGPDCFSLTLPPIRDLDDQLGSRLGPSAWPKLNLTGIF